MKQKSLEEAKAIENPPGVIRKTLAYNRETMLCHFTLKKGASIPLHNHVAVQIGYIVSGHCRFLGDNEFEVRTEEAYCIESGVTHGTEALEDTVYVEVFSPSREEYEDF